MGRIGVLNAKPFGQRLLESLPVDLHFHQRADILRLVGRVDPQPRRPLGLRAAHRELEPREFPAVEQIGQLGWIGTRAFQCCFFTSLILLRVEIAQELPAHLVAAADGQQHVVAGFDHHVVGVPARNPPAGLGQRQAAALTPCPSPGRERGAVCRPDRDRAALAGRDETMVVVDEQVGAVVDERVRLAEQGRHRPGVLHPQFQHFLFAFHAHGQRLDLQRRAPHRAADLGPVQDGDVRQHGRRLFRRSIDLELVDAGQRTAGRLRRAPASLSDTVPAPAQSGFRPSSSD